jgi:phospholipid/cholesterol/gamma-HCH transport system substrate-binding protein
MDERIMQFRVGVMVLATIIIAGILMVVMGEVPKLGLGRRTYSLEVHFPKAPGVSKETPVQKSGILVGRVTEVRFADDSTVIVTVGIHSDVKIRKSERCRIKGGLLGDAVLEFVLGDDVKDKGFYEPGDRIERGFVVSDPLEVLADFKDDLSSAIRTFNKAGQQIGDLATRLNTLVETNDQQIRQIIGETQTALKGFNRAMASIERIAGDKEIQEGLRQSLSDLPKMIERSKKTFDRVQQTIDLTNRNLENLSKFTGPLGERGDRVVLKVADSVERLDELLAQMVQFSKTINSGKGALGRMLNDPDLYQSLERAARNVEQATRKLEPILSDARTLMDKLARHPGFILRDAARPGPAPK